MLANKQVGAGGAAAAGARRGRGDAGWAWSRVARPQAATAALPGLPRRCRALSSSCPRLFACAPLRLQDVDGAATPGDVAEALGLSRLPDAGRYVSVQVRAA